MGWGVVGEGVCADVEVCQKGHELTALVEKLEVSVLVKGWGLDLDHGSSMQ
jgi:hypothetical protein